MVGATGLFVNQNLFGTHIWCYFLIRQMSITSGKIVKVLDFKCYGGGCKWQVDNFWTFACTQTGTQTGAQTHQETQI